MMEALFFSVVGALIFFVSGLWDLLKGGDKYIKFVLAYF